MDFEQARTWLEQLPEPSTWDLDRMRAMAQDAGVAADKIKAIQVAGTNGKGSTCAFLSAILQHAGLKTGLYTSPHLVDVRERIQVNGLMPSKADFAVLAAWAKPFVEKHNASQFEAYTLVAFRHFLDKNVDWAVVEVGLGGKKDATSIVHPQLALITHVALDHADKLGDTLEQIATEKAGIITENGVCLTTADAGAYDAIKKTAREKKARLEKIAPLKIMNENPLAVSINGQTIRPALQGRFQAENAALAVAAARELQHQGVPINDEAMTAGLQNAQWPARMQHISNVIVDGAHNPDGMRALVESIVTAHPRTKWNVVFGVLADKDYRGMVDEISRLSIDSVFLVTPKSPRALPAEKLKPLFEEKKIKNEVVASVEAALKANSGKKVLVCGSLYGAAEALEALQK